MKYRKGKGVMSKDGVTPWAAGTLHVTQGGWHSPEYYSMHNLALCIAALHRGEIERVELITLSNDKYVYELTAAEKRALDNA